MQESQILTSGKQDPSTLKQLSYLLPKLHADVLV